MNNECICDPRDCVVCWVAFLNKTEVHDKNVIQKIQAQNSCSDRRVLLRHIAVVRSL